MTQEQINELRKLADPLVPWCVNHAKESAYGTAVIGHVDEDDNMHEVACFDLTMYDGFEGDSLKMAQYYAAANPAAILALIQQRDELLRIASDAATSLETIHIRSFGDDSYLNHPDQMRAYAGSRAGVVRKEIKDAEIDQ